MNSDLKKRAQALEVTFSRRKQNHITHKPVSTIKNLSESEFEFLSSYYRQKCSNAYKIRKSVLLD